MYYVSGTVDMHLAAYQTVSGRCCIAYASWKNDVISKIWLCRLTCTYLKNNPTKFHRNLIQNNTVS